jgi:hypothetical protein
MRSQYRDISEVFSLFDLTTSAQNKEALLSRALPER